MVPSLRNLTLDLSPLRHHREYRAILIGQAINGMGAQVTRIALPYQLYVTTHSALALGALSSVQLAGILLFSLVGGAVADAVDRRALLFCTQTALCAVSTCLALMALANQSTPWLLFLLAFLGSAFSALDSPARSALIPRLVTRERLSAAISINQATYQTASVIGPGLGGLLIAWGGLPAAYGVDAATFSAAFIALLALPSIPPLHDVPRPSLESVREGLRFVRRVPVILSGFVIDLDAMVFGLPVALFPVLALDFFHAGPQGLGLLVSAPAAGAVLGVVTSGWLQRARWQGRVLIGVVGVWGAAITLFGLMPSLPLAMLFLAVAGGADAISAILRSTINQLTSPDALRGRVSSLHMMVVTSGPRLGDIEATMVASATSAQFSVVSGGLACLLGLVLVARRFPELARYDATAAIAAMEAEQGPRELPAGAAPATNG
ncbi:MAG: MFS transporter [Chloroflexota bacterium]